MGDSSKTGQEEDQTPIDTTTLGQKRRKKRRRTGDLKFEVFQGEEMSKEDFEGLVSMLARWILKDWEKRRSSYRKPTFE